MLHGVYTGAWLLSMLLPSAANAAKAALPQGNAVAVKDGTATKCSPKTA